MPTTMQIFVIVLITNQLTARIIIMPMVKVEATSPKISNGTHNAPSVVAKVSVKGSNYELVSQSL